MIHDLSRGLCSVSKIAGKGASLLKYLIQISFKQLHGSTLDNKQVNGSLFPASVISVYCAYLCYNGLSSEPRDYGCNGLRKHSKQVSDAALVLGMLTMVLSIAYSAVRAGSFTSSLSTTSSPNSGSRNPLLEAWCELESGNEAKKQGKPRPVSYSYMFFHLTLSLASMYSAMLLTGWTLESSELIDVGLGAHMHGVGHCGLLYLDPLRYPRHE